MEKNSKKKPKLGLGGLVASILIIIVVFVILVIANKPESLKDSKGTVVCSFYPVYDMVSTMMDKTGYDIVNMTKGVTGCLHDYQITTKDMKLIEKADLFVANGMGMEHFLEEIAEKRDKLQIIYATDAFEDAYQMNHSAQVHEKEDEHEHEHGEVNSHLWMNASMYLEEIEYIKGVLCNKYPDEVERIEANYTKYYRDVTDAKDKSSELMQKYKRYIDEGKLSEEICVIAFNEAFVPLAESLGIEVIAEFSLDENDQPSAGEISYAITEAKQRKYVLVLVEKDNTTAENAAKKVIDETNAELVYVKPLTSQDAGSDLPAGIWYNLFEIDGAVDSFLKK